MKKNKDKFINATLCTHCGYCLPVCPTYRVDKDEILSPRGRVSIVLALAQGRLTGKEAQDPLSYCLVCRACHAACPVGVRPAKLVLSARNLTPQPTPWFIQLIHAVTNRHALTAWVSRLIRFYQKSGLQEKGRRRKIWSHLPAVARWERLIPAHRPDPIPPFPTTPPTRPSDASSPPIKAAILCGCMARLFQPRVGPSTANLLHHVGLEVVVMEGFGCCGAPFRESGNRKKFLTQARRTLDAFQRCAQVDWVLCDSSVCLVTVRSYGKAFSSDPHYEALAKQFVDKLQRLEPFLAQHLPNTLPSNHHPTEHRFTVHDHCQAANSLGEQDKPKMLMEKVAGTLVKLPRSEHCCGTGGDYMLRYPEMSHKIAEDKLAAIRESTAETIVGTNPGCLLNLEAGLNDLGVAINVRHLSEVLWQVLSQPGKPR